jgi:hypothetical protein
MLSPIRGVIRTAAISNKAGPFITLLRGRHGGRSSSRGECRVHEGPAYVLDTPVQERAGAVSRCAIIILVRAIRL